MHLSYPRSLLLGLKIAGYEKTRPMQMSERSDWKLGSQRSPWWNVFEADDVFSRVSHYGIHFLH